MKGKRFLFPLAIASFCASLILLCVVLFAHSRIDSPGWVVNALIVGLILCFVTLFAYLAVFAVNRFLPSCGARLPKSFSGFGIVLLVLLMVLGAVGQIIYSIGTKTYTVQTGVKEETEIIEYNENADIILLRDISGSMGVYEKATVNACTYFLNHLAAGCRVGGGAFGDRIQYRNLAEMNSANKADLIAALSSGYLGAGNNFLSVMKSAFDDFSANSSPDRHRVIVLFSDGEGTFNPTAIESQVKSGVEIYIIRPELSSPSSNLMNYLSSDNDYPVLTTYGSDEAKMQKIIDILNDFAHHEEERTITTPIYEVRTDVVFTEGLILYDAHSEQNTYRVLVRLGFFAVYAVLIQLFFFRKLRFSSVIVSLVTVGASWGLATLASSMKALMIAAAGLAAFMFTLFAIAKDRTSDYPGVKR